MSGHGTIVLGSATTTTAAVILPNTGSNSILTVAAVVTLVAGIAITVTSVARVLAKRSFKA